MTGGYLNSIRHVLSDLDLSAIARTSVAMSGSPPSPDSALRSKPAVRHIPRRDLTRN